MKAVVQRVTHSEVVVDGVQVGACKQGLMVLLGVAEGDTDEDTALLCKKILNLRIFSDENGKMNLSLLDIHGEMLVISQFTLLANCRHGNRPDFLASARPDVAKRMYEDFVALAKEQVPHVETGIFAADMKVTLLNDGPVTILLDTDQLKKAK